MVAAPLCPNVSGESRRDGPKRTLRQPVAFFCLAFAALLISGASVQSQSTKPAKFELVRMAEHREQVSSWYRSHAFPNSFIAVTEASIWRVENDVWRKLDLPTGQVMTILSRGGRYVGVARWAQDGNVSDRTLIIEVYTSEAVKRFTLQHGVAYDEGVPSMLLSDDEGALVLGLAPIGRILFHDANGALRRQVDLFPGASYDLERTLHLDLSDNGLWLAAVAGQRGAAPPGSAAPDPSARPHVFYFSRTGEERWRVVLRGQSGLQVAISPDGEFVAAGSYSVQKEGTVSKSTVIFDKEGKQLGENDFLFKRAAFSADSKRLLLAENSRAAVVALPSGRILWTAKISRREGMIAGVRILNQGLLAALLVARSEYTSSGFLFINPILKLYGPAGALQQEHGFPEQTFAHPGLFFSEDQRTLFVRFRRATYWYEAR
ncbi:MAG: hypothetical protein ACE5IY_15565 [bacterium]